jgi:integrase/recombinase XerD
MRPITQHYRQILEQLRAWTDSLGYRSIKLTGPALFLGWLERAGVLELRQITPAHIKAYYAHLQERPARYGGALSPHTINGYLGEIRLLLRWAEQNELVRINPMADLRFPTPPVLPRATMSKAEIEQLYAVCKVPLEKVLLGLFYGCGLRRSEAERLDSGDVDAKAALLYVRRGKGNKRRVIPLAPRVLEDLQTYRYEQRPRQIGKRTTAADRRALVLNRVGQRMRGGSYHKLFNRLKERTENRELIIRGVSLHSLRHSIATHLLADGMAIERVRDFLGHDCLETTQIYTRVNTEQL